MVKVANSNLQFPSFTDLPSVLTCAYAHILLNHDLIPEMLQVEIISGPTEVPSSFHFLPSRVTVAECALSL